jgi:TonB family protein
MKTLYKLSLLIAFVLLTAGLTFAQSERESGVALYKQGDFAGAVRLLKQASKKDANDAQVFYYLGLAYLKQEKNKESEKALKKAVALDAQNAESRSALSYVYLLVNKTVEAQNEAQAALKINPNEAQAHYIIGVVNLRNGSYNYAYERAKKAVEINRNFASAYLLKSKALVSSFSLQAGTVIKPLSARAQLLQEASEDLEKYLSLSPTGEDAEFQRENLESIKFFSEYYNRPENQKPINFDAPEKPDENETPLKIISKPRAIYTDKARSSGVSGIIRLAVGFSADGKVKHILIIKPLGYGLDEQAVRAAREIKFEPAIKDGKPISKVKFIEYSFMIY